ncbi:heterokaryon incompatibility protein-domain-containing protein [Fusarium oxysporum]|nr:heterokaryon incompatibility protein-domain-containing protein [Fusarium oxysporum]
MSIMTSPQRAPRVCRICKAKKKACGKELPTCSYCFKRGFGWVYEDESDTPPISDNAAEVFKPWSFTLFPMSISTTTLDRTMAYHLHYFYKVVGQSPLQAGKRFLDNFQRWLPIMAPRRLHEHVELSERGLPGADVSVLLLSICLVTLRSGGDLADPFLHHSAVHVTVKTLYAQVQAITHASIPLIQTGVILSAYEYASGQIGSAYISIAACIRMAQVVGVDAAYDKLGAVQEETRLHATSEWNLWWSIIVLERFILLEYSDTGRRDRMAVCPSSDVPLPSDTESNSEYIPTYCTMSSSTIQGSSGLSSFGRQAQAIYLLDHCLNETSQSEQRDSEERIFKLQQLDKDLQKRLSVFMTQTPHEPGLRCGTIATVIRSLYILHEEILSIAGSLPVDADREGLVKSSEAALETITKIMIDVAKHHLDYIVRHGVDSLAFCCACNLRVAIRFLAYNQPVTRYTALTSVHKQTQRTMSQINHLGTDESSQVGDDMHEPLLDIRQRYADPSIVKQLKSLGFLKKLNSTQPTLRLRTINAFTQRKYVALSYTWKSSPEEVNVPDAGYLFQDIESGQMKQSSVRNTVFSRIKQYMDHVNCKYLWIDQHCIHQQDGEEKEIGMQAMDRVYSLSHHPAALLSWSISTTQQLQLLVDILSGSFVTRRGDKYLPSSSAHRKSVLDVFQLLHYITSDTWFSRGWTYQENYRANNNMTLLITHSLTINLEKPSHHFESLDGELLISSKDFYEEATKLCLAYSNYQPTPPYLTTILSRAKRYKISLASSDGSAPVSMSPTIIEDIRSRRLEREWDRLAIIANCCQYAKRLNSTQLQGNKHSLSLSLLTLVLMNGEILRNHPRDKVDVSAARKMTITEFLHKHFYYGLDCPWENAKLTFNKGCRFANVDLTEEGVRTRGYLWRFDGEISTAQFRNYSQTRKRKRNRQPVEEAIMMGNLLHTAELLDSGPLGVAVFVGQAEDTDTDCDSDGSSEMDSEMSTDSDDHDQDSYVFTSFDSAQFDRGGFDLNDLDKHVSLEVDCLTSSFVIMISRNLLTGTVVLLAASLANAGPCRPSSIASSSTVITSVSETATSSFEGEAATSTASIDATQTATTATESESESETGTTFIVETTPTVSSVETTTTALVDTTTAASVITSVDTTTEATTTTAAATTTSEEPEALQTIYLYAGGSNDPALAPLGGTGFTALGDTSLPDVEYIDFTTDTTSALFFTLGERTAKVKIGNGANVGKLAGYSTSGDFSLVIVAETTLAEENGISPLDCEIVDGNGFQMLQCLYGDEGVADLWTCAGHLTLVKPGVDFTSKCARAATAYKLGYIQVIDY